MTRIVIIIIQISLWIVEFFNEFRD